MTPNEYAALLDHAEREIEQMYDALGELAARLDIDPLDLPKPDEGNTGTMLYQMGLHLRLSAVREYVLAARHELHGGLTRVAIGRAGLQP